MLFSVWASRIWDVLDLKPRSSEKGPGRGGGNAACHTEAGGCVCVCLGPARTAVEGIPSPLMGKVTHTYIHTRTHTLIKHYIDQKGGCMCICLGPARTAVEGILSPLMGPVTYTHTHTHTHTHRLIKHYIDQKPSAGGGNPHTHTY